MLADSLEEAKSLTSFEALADYRRRVGDMYACAREPTMGLEERWVQFRCQRDALFKHHPQSALSMDQKKVFTSLPYFPYNPEFRLVLAIDTNVQQDLFETDLEGDGLLRMKRFGKIHFNLKGKQFTLFVYWILGYGGGLFLPFRDQTNQTETFGGGRYVLDTIKNVDLGRESGRLVVDFNYAYNPSCAYHPQWHCPLPLPENWLPVPIQAGEKKYLPPV